MSKTTIDDAIKLWHAGRLSAAINQLSPLLALNSADPVVHGLLGAISYEAQKYRKAYSHWSVTARASPNSELAIRGMVHAAIHLGWINCAAKAAKQLYTLTGKSDDQKLLRAISGA